MQYENTNLQPDNRLLAVADEVLVGLGEMTTSHEAAIGGERRRMSCLEYQMTLTVDELAFLLRVATP